MSISDDLFSVLVFVITVLTAKIICGVHKTDISEARYVSIDGLRGCLSVFVFIHHSCVWRQFLVTDSWALPQSRLCAHLGNSSVTLFFMITSFLFTSRILASKDRPIDWGRFFLSRIMRLIPLYAIAITLMSVLIIAKCDWEMRVPVASFMDGYFRWVGLTIRGAPLLNDFGFTHNVICSVYWTLRVEYVFYLCLPYLSVALLRTVRLRWLFLSASLLFYVYHFRGWRCGIHDAMPFSGGVIAAFLARSEFVCKLLSGAVASAFGLAIIAVTVLYFPPEARSLCVIPLSLLFVLISCGNDFFGTISSRWALILGDVSYGVYLFHGLLLFLCIDIIVDNRIVLANNSNMFWTLVSVVAVILVVSSWLAHVLIERPVMRKVDFVKRCLLTLPW